MPSGAVAHTLYAIDDGELPEAEAGIFEDIQGLAVTKRAPAHAASRETGTLPRPQSRFFWSNTVRGAI